MQIISPLSASSASASLSSSSSSSHSSAGRRIEEKGMDKFESLHHSFPPPTHFKGKKRRHHGLHSRLSPPPPHHHHHHHPPPPPPPHCFLQHHERGTLRVKPSKHSKKVRKLHHLLMKSCNFPKGPRDRHRHCHRHRHHHVHFPPPESHRHMHSPPPERGFFSLNHYHMRSPPPEGGISGINVQQHSPGCCLHFDTDMGDQDWPAKEQRPSHEMSSGHHCRPHRRRRSHPPHAHKQCGSIGPCIRSEIVGGTWPSVAEAPAEPPIERGAPLTDSTMPPADEATPAGTVGRSNAD